MLNKVSSHFPSTISSTFVSTSPDLLLVSVYGVAGDADAVGRPGRVDGDGQPADQGDAGRGSLLQLHVQWRVRGTCGARSQD